MGRAHCEQPARGYVDEIAALYRLRVHILQDERLTNQRKELMEHIVALEAALIPIVNPVRG